MTRCPICMTPQATTGTCDDCLEYEFGVEDTMTTGEIMGELMAAEYDYADMDVYGGMYSEM